MYKPTKEELEALGFGIEIYCEGNSWYAFTKKGKYIEYKGFKEMWKLGMNQFYPESIEDIRTLIRILNPS